MAPFPMSLPDSPSNGGKVRTRKSKAPVEVKIKHFATKIAGVTHTNEDGTDRQQLLAKCFHDQELTLTREPENPHDDNAVRVSTADHHDLGYVPKEFAEHLAVLMDSGVGIACRFSKHRGGSGEAKTLGSDIIIDVADDEICSAPSIKRALAELKSLSAAFLRMREAADWVEAEELAGRSAHDEWRIDAAADAKYRASMSRSGCSVVLGFLSLLVVAGFAMLRALISVLFLSTLLIQ